LLPLIRESNLYADPAALVLPPVAGRSHALLPVEPLGSLDPDVPAPLLFHASPDSTCPSVAALVLR
jgi:hypothetical protein